MTKKGYISFFLYSLICFILLYPFLFYKSPFPLWPSFVLKETFDNHILHKRAVVFLIADKFEEIKPILKLLKTTKKVEEVSILFPPPFNLLLKSTTNLISNREFRSAFTKTYLLFALQELSLKFSKYSNYNLEVFCFPQSSSLDPSEKSFFFEIFNHTQLTPSILFCYSLLEYLDGPADSAGKIKVHKGFFVLTSSKLSNSTATSQIKEFEVE